MAKGTMAEIARMAGELEDLAAGLAVTEVNPRSGANTLAVVGASYLLRLVGNDIGAILSYEDGYDGDMAELNGFLVALRMAMAQASGEMLPPR